MFHRFKNLYQTPKDPQICYLELTGTQLSCEAGPADLRNSGPAPKLNPVVIWNPDPVGIKRKNCVLKNLLYSYKTLLIILITQSPLHVTSLIPFTLTFIHWWQWWPLQGVTCSSAEITILTLMQHCRGSLSCSRAHQHVDYMCWGLKWWSSDCLESALLPHSFHRLCFGSSGALGSMKAPVPTSHK